MASLDLEPLSGSPLVIDCRESEDRSPEHCGPARLDRWTIPFTLSGSAGEGSRACPATGAPEPVGECGFGGLQLGLRHSAGRWTSKVPEMVFIPK